MKKEYWITPPEIYKALDQEFHFDFDPCPYPYQGFDGTEVEWGNSTYLNPPFRKSDGQNGKGPTAFIRKAIEENKKGKNVVIMINTNAFINMLIEAGAEMRSMKRVKWLDGKTGEPWKSPSNTTCFILRKTPPNRQESTLSAYKVVEEWIKENKMECSCGKSEGLTMKEYHEKYDWKDCETTFVNEILSSLQSFLKDKTKE